MTCMYVELLESKSNRSPYKRVMHLLCDECGKEFIRRFTLNADLGLHWCTQICRSQAMRSGHELDLLIRKKSRDKWGVEYSTQRAVHISKIKRTVMARYGVTCIFSLDACKQKARRAAWTVAARNKRTDTILKKYSTLENYKKHVVKKCRSTCRNRYGTDHNFKIDAVIANRAETWNIRYGVSNPFQSPVCQDKIRRTQFSKYGSWYVQTEQFKSSYDRVAARIRSHETMKRNGSYGKSKLEDVFFEFLVNRFGSDDIERQKPVYKWLIDFYIRSIDMHVQFDGVYWHGLDRPIEVIREHRTSRDIVIERKWNTDREQDVWFHENGLKLTRVTDRQFKSGTNFFEVKT